MCVCVCLCMLAHTHTCVYRCVGMYMCVHMHICIFCNLLFKDSSQYHIKLLQTGEKFEVMKIPEALCGTQGHSVSSSRELERLCSFLAYESPMVVTEDWCWEDL